jgi:hypothetical protein
MGFFLYVKLVPKFMRTFHLLPVCCNEDRKLKDHSNGLSVLLGSVESVLTLEFRAIYDIFW